MTGLHGSAIPGAPNANRQIIASAIRDTIAPAWRGHRAMAFLAFTRS